VHWGIESDQSAKIKPAISFHVLRHTHGSALAMKGVPMGVIAEQLGHADTRGVSTAATTVSSLDVLAQLRRAGMFDSR
jgi:integrase